MHYLWAVLYTIVVPSQMQTQTYSDYSELVGLDLGFGCVSDFLHVFSLKI